MDLYYLPEVLCCEIGHTDLFCVHTHLHVVVIISTKHPRMTGLEFILGVFLLLPALLMCLFVPGITQGSGETELHGVGCFSFELVGSPCV